jgi:hypothetical protein
MSRSYKSFPPWPLHGGSRTALLCIILRYVTLRIALYVTCFAFRTPVCRLKNCKMRFYQKRTVAQRLVFSFGITISASKETRLMPST